MREKREREHGYESARKCENERAREQEDKSSKAR